MSGAAVAAGSVGITGCTGNNDEDDELTINLVHTQSSENVNVQALESEFVERLEEESNGRMTVDIEAGTLGSPEDNVEAAQSGTMDIVIETTEGVAPRFPEAEEYGFADVPFVIREPEHYRRIEEEFLLPEDGLNGILLDGGLRLFPAHRWGVRWTSANRPITHPDDVQDLNIRLPEFDSWIQTWEEIGAVPTPVDLDELYEALETGLVDSAEGPISQFMSASLYEVQSHNSATEHLLGMYHFILNEEFYQGLNDEDRELLETTIEESIPEIEDFVREEEENLYERAQEEGVTLVEADEVDQEAFVEAAMPYLEEAQQEWAVNLDEIQELA